MMHGQRNIISRHRSVTGGNETVKHHSQSPSCPAVLISVIENRHKWKRVTVFCTRL